MPEHRPTLTPREEAVLAAIGYLAMRWNYAERLVRIFLGRQSKIQSKFQVEAIRIWTAKALVLQKRLEREVAVWQEAGRVHLNHLIKAFAEGRDLRNHYVHAIYSTWDRGHASPAIPMD